MADGSGRPVTNRQRFFVLVLFAIVAMAAILTQLGIFGNGDEVPPEEGVQALQWTLEEWTAPDGAKGWQAYVMVADDAADGKDAGAAPPRVLGLRCTVNTRDPVMVFANAGARLSREETRPEDYRYTGCSRPREQPGAMSTGELMDSMFPVGGDGAQPRDAVNRETLRHDWEAGVDAYRQCIARNASVRARLRQSPAVGFAVTAGRRDVPSFVPGHYRDLGRLQARARCAGFKQMTVLEAPSSFNESPYLLITDVGTAEGHEMAETVYHDTLARYLFEGSRVTVSHPTGIEGGGCRGGGGEAEPVSFTFATAGGREAVGRLRALCGFGDGVDLRPGRPVLVYPEPTMPGLDTAVKRDRYNRMIYSQLPIYRYAGGEGEKSYSDCRDPEWTRRTGFSCEE